MVYQGAVRGGVVVLSPGTQLPEGITVTVQPQQRVHEEASTSYTLRNGIPVFPQSESAAPVTVELVNQLRDELGDSKAWCQSDLQ